MLPVTQIIEGCKKKERKAQKALYDLLNNKLMGICIRYTRSREDAKDIFQDSFIKIFKKIDQVKEAQSLERWAKRIVVNTAINHYNKHKKQQEYLYVDDIEKESDDFERIVDQLSNEQLIELINALPEGCKLVFNLYVIEGYNHKEISEILEIAEGTSKSQLNRAKSLLKKSLEQIGIHKYLSYGAR